MHCQPLDGEWSLHKAGTEDSFPANVPGNIHIDLMAVEAIPDPFIGDNETRVAWVAESDWTYRRTFKPEDALLPNKRIFLECDGLDTISTVRLNGETIAHTDNMFRSYKFEITNKILRGENTIEVEFSSPVKYGAAKLGTDDSVISPGDSIPGSPYLRKAMYQWGWDWAPKIPTSGIWRSIRLVGYTDAKLEDIHIRQHHEDGVVTIHAGIKIERFSDREITLRARLISPDGEVSEQSMKLNAGAYHEEFNFHVQNPELWWPNGYGAQPLYEIQLTLLDGEETLDSRSRRIGLRTIELQQKNDSWGRSFVFIVNGTPIFAKGANWVPADQFPARVTREQYHDLISSAAIANMNMFRVWGGGIYESDVFYNLCDEYGILIWQDFMFACAHYPVNHTMLENIGIEAAENVRRIRDHACLALWCGNNEMEWFIVDTWDNKDERRRQYSELFHGLLHGVCAEEDPDTTYWSSSPASATPFESPNAEHEGDGHYWDVWHGRKPFSDYRNHYYRFMSEFGFQSLPSIDTIRSFAWPTEWNLTSYIMESHQKNPAGNELILYYMAKNFRIPNGFPMTVYVSQILQAEAMRYGVEHWRRNRNDNRCMGTLYWQYNDCWPVASWSGIDYNHRWKALHYYAKRFYAPVLFSAAVSDSRVQLHITNDNRETFTSKIRWSLEKLNGVKLKDGEADVEVAPLTDSCVVELDLKKKLGKTNPREVVLVYGLWHGKKRLSLGMSTFVPDKHLDLLDPGIVYDVEDKDGEIHISLAAHNAARYVMMEVPGHDVRFSDNYLDLPAGRLVTIIVEDAAGLTAEEIEAKMKVISLWDSY